MLLNLNMEMFPAGMSTGSISTTSIPTSGKDVFSADLNGDGHSDILTANFQYVGGIKEHSSMSVYYKNPNGSNFTHAFNTAFSGSINQGIDIANFVTSDFNGDGLEDVLTFKHAYQGSTHYLSQIQPYFSNTSGSGFTVPSAVPLSGAFSCIPSHLKFLHVGDFDGDGRTDFITLLGNCVGNPDPDYRAFLSFSGGANPKQYYRSEFGWIPSKTHGPVRMIFVYWTTMVTEKVILWL